MADKVLEALSSPDVINKIVPIFAEKIGEIFSSMIEDEVKKCVDKQVKPIAETIENHSQIMDITKQKVCKQFIWIDKVDGQVKQHVNTMKELDLDIDALYKKIADLETRLENQEQYSCHTCVRFHNIRVPVDAEGKIIHPVNTDDIILDICNAKLGLHLTLDDIGRSHVIGKVKTANHRL
ncbi:unnamed protein product [Mytilus coruscus]|uniref:Uncharacterized protein n=1 Tax=Mytilus coruscus TaxID=42192 RepID=A0A6J8EEC9_MYTCO|nr:unnamed protein product [Mytilus coruscus]